MNESVADGESTDPVVNSDRPRRAVRYAKRAGWVTLGIILGAAVAAPSNDTVNAAKASAKKIEHRAHTTLTDARADAKRIESDAEGKGQSIVAEATAVSRQIAKTNAVLRKQTGALQARKRSLIAQTHSLESTVSAQRRELAKAESAGGGSGSCDENYSGACLDPNAGDYDCAGGSGDGPNYTGMVTVVGYDTFDLDRDGDGIACDT